MYPDGSRKHSQSPTNHVFSVWQDEEREKVHSLFRGSACVCQHLDSEYGKTCPRFGGQGRKKISYYVLGKLSSKDIILEFMGIRVICCDDSHKA
jgi:hypothetical protein